MSLSGRIPARLENFEIRRWTPTTHTKYSRIWSQGRGKNKTRSKQKKTQKNKKFESKKKHDDRENTEALSELTQVVDFQKSVGKLQQQS
jgi:hypothetical protein